jgi:hypothetical protein
MHLYPGPRPLYHFDAWMAGRERAFLDSGGAEHLSSEGVAAVEWAERVAAWLPRPRLELRFGHRAGGATGRAAAGDGERSIAATVVPASDARDASAALLAEALDRALGRALARLPAGVRLAPDRSREPRSARRVGRPEAP